MRGARENATGAYMETCLPAGRYVRIVGERATTQMGVF